ncbi:MAG: glycosyltransferase [Acidobacteria bacterium]|nr:glycosyltransferase [Acidobacteriota bacterium]
MAQTAGQAITYVSWAESCSRSDHTARELGGASHMVYLPELGSRPSTILLKYLGQWTRTSAILRQERPSAVFVMSPPVIAALPAFWYAWRHGARVVLDTHTAAFLHPRWRYLQWLQRWQCRRAATNLVHNEHLADIVRAWGGHVTLVPDVPVEYQSLEPLSRTEAFTVAVVCSFNYDEPIGAILEAAAALSDVRFLMTGNPKHFPKDLESRVPPNVTRTGFLSVAAYGGLLAGADAVMTLTTRDHTMLRGAYEAIYQGTPVIVSDWPILRQAFPQGAVHVDNTPGGISEGVRTMASQALAYRTGAEELREAKRQRWQRTREAIRARIGRV